MELLYENQEWILDNENYQTTLKIIQEVFSELVQPGLRGSLKLNFDSVKKVLDGKLISEVQHAYDDLMPSFECLKPEPGSEKSKFKYLKINLILEVVQLGKGASFGELSLLEDKPRAATILCLENTRFATLDKEPFNKVIGRMLRKKFAKDVEFISKFPFLKGLTRKTKTKICYPMETRTFVRGQTLYNEGDPVENILFLESGEFETTKNVYVKKNKENKVVCEFMRICSDKDRNLIQKLLDPQTKIIYSSKIIPKEEFKETMQGSKKIPISISNKQMYDCLGLIESVFDSPSLHCTYMTSVKCISKEGTARVINKEEV